ncbi:MAG: ABC transporter substrate-binding protein [Alphaproteobacteria bacterium]|nr:ABC transporter substrate-binding protein [Alphaproteobacteria bacterium]
MKRRDFIVWAAGTAAWPVVTWAQQPAKIPRIGILHSGPKEFVSGATFDGFRRGLSEFGYVEGRNIALEIRGADDQYDRHATLAKELVELKVDLIVAINTPSGRAAQQATSTIPIVVPFMIDPVGDGLVASLGRPGGNITGSTYLGTELVPKCLELLKEALPKHTRVAGLWHPDTYGKLAAQDLLTQAEAASRTLGLQLQLVAVRGPEGFESAFSTMIDGSAEALFVFASPMLFRHRGTIIDFATRHRLPSVFPFKESVVDGGLISYGANLLNLVRRSAGYVDKILKGAKPADLPVQQPTVFELVVNLKTAKALGITVPESILMRADEIIQ